MRSRRTSLGPSGEGTDHERRLADLSIADHADLEDDRVLLGGVLDRGHVNAADRLAPPAPLAG
jgi:hypothetical protein